MPNYCFNRLTIRGPTAVEIAESLVPNNRLDLNLIDHIPSNLPNIHWADWCLCHWGTTDVYKTTVEERLNSALIRFDTPWQPPARAIAKLALDFPENAYRLWFKTNENNNGTIYFTEDFCWQVIVCGDCMWREYLNVFPDAMVKVWNR